MNTFKLQLARWGQGLVRGCVQGGAVAAKAVVGTAALSGFGFPALGLSVNQAAAVFLAGALYHLWDYLAANPLPDLAGEETTKDTNQKAEEWQKYFNLAGALQLENAQLREELSRYKMGSPNSQSPSANGQSQMADGKGI